MRVLLIDDDEFAHRVVSLDLADIRSTRYVVEWQSSWQSGLDALCTEQHDVCLLDFQLGERSGLELLQEAQRRGVRTPIVMLTAQSGDGLDMEAMRAGATDYLVKGEFGPGLLERCLRYAIERRRTLEKLRESEERYALAARGTNDGLWDWKLATGELYLSDQWKALIGYGDDEIPHRIEEWYLRVHPQDLDRLKADLHHHLTGKTKHFECEHRLLHKDGTYRWMASRGSAVHDASGQAVRLTGSQRDITHSRGHDPLTGLPNRSLYLDRLARVMERSRRRNQYHYAVVFLDLDRFKVVNDSLGHVIGDDLLISIARRLSGCVRSADTVARLGGDEFVFLLEDVGEPADATRVANRIHQALSTPHKIGNREIFTSASLGIALGSAGYERPEDLLRDADAAMYRAKTAGRSRHELFDQQMHQRAVAVLLLETELRRAVELEQLRVFYQPIVSLDTGHICGFEALVRWNHPVRGMVPPDEFIPLAEETGIVVQIDRWVFQQACRQLRAWQARFGPLTMSVNLSKKQLGQPDFLGEVERVLSETAVPASTVSLELTESVVMENAELVFAMLSQLRGRDLQLSMDDFGTGYSSLSYLHRMPFTSLKVDRSFVRQLGNEPGAEEVVRAILTLSRAFRLKVTAEGVETPEQLELLRRMGCDQAQGYFISRPVDAGTAEKLLVQCPRF